LYLDHNDETLLIELINFLVAILTGIHNKLYKKVSKLLDLVPAVYPLLIIVNIRNITWFWNFTSTSQ
jgi:hypothetical protein